MVRHVFSKLPKWCAGMKPRLLWVRCAKCGTPHQEYFGPRSRDELRAELHFLRHQLEIAFAILARMHPPRAPQPQRRRQ